METDGKLSSLEMPFRMAELFGISLPANRSESRNGNGIKTVPPRQGTVFSEKVAFRKTVDAAEAGKPLP